MPSPQTLSDLWLDRLVQLLHDPPGKVKYLAHHKKLSKELAEAIAALTWTDDEWRKAMVNRPDAVAAGADRMCFPFGPVQPFNRVERQLVTHPLERIDDTPPLLLSSREGASPEGKASGEEERLAQREVAKRLTAKELASEGDIEGAFYRVWRRFCADLILDNREERLPDGIRRDLFWSALPADTRCPDVSIWDHTRMAAALSFMNVPTSTKKRPTKLPIAREPWLLQISLSGIQSFIHTARTTRDLWVGSFLLSDLAFCAMLPILEHYGPTAVLYPDLRANPRMDAWLDQEKLHWHTLRKELDASSFGADATSFAAVIPNSFVALVAFGGEDGLLPLRELADQCEKRVKERWSEHANQVREWMERVTAGQSGQSWQALWQQQHEHADVVRVRWTAVPWIHADRMKEFTQSEAFPFQDASKLPQEKCDDRKRREERTRRFAPWVSDAMWTHVERARYAFGSVNPTILQMERGFDYGITNAQLRAVHQVRKQAAVWPRPVEHEKIGVACTLCGQRTALSADASVHSDHVDSLVHQARLFWSHDQLDPELRGAERLCAVCALKRFLVVAGGPEKGINRLWANEDDRNEIRTSEARVPFPSTTAICAQQYIAELCKTSDPDVLKAIEAVVKTHRALHLPATQSPHCLRLLAELHDGLPENDIRKDFLKREPQEVLYPDAMEAHLAVTTSPTKAARDDRGGRRKEEGERHVQAIRDLLAVARDQLGLAAPSSRLAVIKVDGDSLSRLLTGEPGRLHARWRDVVHPELVEKLDADQAGRWSSLLDSERLMGPSLHAFVTRALGAFAHRLAPWVVEQEFHGRLVYAGGDDLLVLAPASEALLIVARLQQLYSAAWIVDTDPTKDAWAWRRMTRRGQAVDAATARQRFRIPLRPLRDAAAPGPAPIQLPAERVELHVADRPTQDVREASAPPLTEGPVIPMLGHGQTLSAGIVYAHFKASLGSLVDDAECLVNEQAKEAAGRGAVAMAWRSRNGEKLRFVMPWRRRSAPEESPSTQRSLVRSWERVVAAFSALGSDDLDPVSSSGQPDFVTGNSGSSQPSESVGRVPILSGNLPYKLRQQCTIASMIAERSSDNPEQLRAALKRLAGGDESGPYDDVVALWEEGLRTCTVDQIEHSVDGLAIARALALDTSEGQS